MKSLANEVAKNLVLAGIGSLTIIDHETVTEEDLQSQFFLEAATQDPDIVNQGKNVRVVFDFFAATYSQSRSAPKPPVLKCTK